MKYIYYAKEPGRKDIDGVVGPSGQSYSFKVGEYVEIKEARDLNRFMATFSHIFTVVDEIPVKEEVIEQPVPVQVEPKEIKEEPAKKEVKKEIKKSRGLLGRL